MNPVIVGLDSGHNSPEPLNPAYPSGNRLMRLMGLDFDEFLAQTDRVNLHVHPDNHAPDLDAAANLTPVLRGRRVVFLGRQVAEAFQLPTQEWMSWRLCPGPEPFAATKGFVAAALPHPSARSTWWNDPTNVGLARDFIQRLCQPCVHVEGPDGSGKTTLAEQLARNLGFPLVPTDDPPRSWAECLARVERRLAPGLVCDRSSGLVSELVYGPVLRGKTITREEDVWKVVWSVKYAVTFVYCRPPTLSPRIRPGEDPAHISAIGKKLEQLRWRYDEVMNRIDRLGARVIKYDYTRHSVGGAAQCVA